MLHHVNLGARSYAMSLLTFSAMEFKQFPMLSEVLWPATLVSMHRAPFKITKRNSDSANQGLGVQLVGAAVERAEGSWKSALIVTQIGKLVVALITEVTDWRCCVQSEMGSVQTLQTLQDALKISAPSSHCNSDCPVDTQHCDRMAGFSCRLGNVRLSDLIAKASLG